MRSYLIAGILLLSTFTSFAQRGRIEGKITDAANGQPLSGVSVTVIGAANGTASAVDGRYGLGVNAGAVSLVYSYNGVIKQVDDIQVTAGKTTIQDVSIQQQSKTQEAVIVRSVSTARKETAASLITFQKNTNTVASVISAEAIRRSPDRNTGEVLKRMPGTSLQEGKFIVIRGLADRYNQAMLNGILLTSTEPDRKTFSFDLIPSSMIDNIVVNKAFVPEYPGEWAGGLIQVNTKDIPSKNFFQVQVGTGFNTQTIGKDFYTNRSGKLSWLGIDDGSRGLPTAYPGKAQFAILPAADKIAIGKALPNVWDGKQTNSPLNLSLQANGGWIGKLFGKTLGANVGVNYSKTNNYFDLLNRQNKINDGIVSVETNFMDQRYREAISSGAFGSLSLQLNPRNKIAVRSIVNVNTTSSVTHRNGTDVSRADSILKGTELSFKQNTFFTVQANGDHGLSKDLKLKWYGSFNILDGYIPDQRRLLYSKRNDSEPFRAVIANSLSQQSGSRIYQSLSDYIYTGGGDLAYQFDMFHRKQTLKGGYMIQVKDRLYDAQLFANYLARDNDSLKQLSPAEIFKSQNFGDGSSTSNLFAFNALIGRTYRYMANTILNAGFVQMDNQFSNKLRVVYGLRVEHYAQLVGSPKKSDPRYTNTKVIDYLPGINATYKVNPKTNIRLSGSQTVIRPELRELSFLNLYDFELNASVQGKPTLERTKMTNLDLRYELYPRAGETFSVGTFYKYFRTPIEQLFNEGSGGASTFFFQNPEKAIAYGAELEIRKKLDFSEALKHFSVQANASYIHSRVTDAGFKLDRPLQGQSPYVFNAGLMYDLEDKGFSTTLLFNQVGERIYLVGDVSAGAGSPDIYEAPRALLDLQLAKKILKQKGEVKLNVSDLLNTTQYFYQNTNSNTKFQKNEDAYRFTRKQGTTFSLNFQYAF